MTTTGERILSALEIVITFQPRHSSDEQLIAEFRWPRLRR
jgi:hypothetical protein